MNEKQAGMARCWEGRTLVLNADFIPLNLIPLSTVSWQEAVILVYQNKATAIDYYDREVRSPSVTMKVPSVVVLKQYKYFKKVAKLNKYNIKLRDMFVCQYCGKMHSHRALTIDHVVPKSHGGRFEWNNLVASCKSCNADKGNNKKIVPKKKPKAPTYFQLAKNLMKFESVTNEHWKQYVNLE